MRVTQDKKSSHYTLYLTPKSLPRRVYDSNCSSTSAVKPNETVNNSRSENKPRWIVAAFLQLIGYILAKQSRHCDINSLRRDF